MLPPPPPPPSYLEVLYLFRYFPHLSPPPSGFKLGRVFRRFDRTVTVVLSVELIVELPSTTRALPRPEDVDQKDSRIDSTRHTPGSTEVTPETVFCLSALVVHYPIIDHPSPPCLSYTLVALCVTGVVRRSCIIYSKC